MAKSDVLEEQRLKAFEVNICVTENTGEFLNIFGKINGSEFWLAKKAKRGQGFIAMQCIGTSLVCCRNLRD